MRPKSMKDARVRLHLSSCALRGRVKSNYLWNILTFWIGESSLEIAKSNHKTENCMPFALCVAFWSVWSFENSSLEAPAYAFGSPFGATWLILGAIGVPSGRQRGTKILFVRTMFGKRVDKWVQKRYQKNTWELNRKLIPKWEPLTC